MKLKGLKAEKDGVTLGEKGKIRADEQIWGEGGEEKVKAGVRGKGRGRLGRMR